MLFNSFAFVLLFLPATLVGFFLLGRINAMAAATFLGAASLVFYGYWDPRYVALLLFSVALNYAVGYLVGHSVSRRRAYWLTAFGIGADLALLGYYKYVDFFIRTIDAATGAAFPMLHVILPLGISFFTFTQIAFLADTYKAGVKEYNPVHYLLFVTYFPHLIAGPILHHKEMMPQFAEPATYRPRTQDLFVGLTTFMIGLTKKVIVADTFAVIANPIFAAGAAHHEIDCASAWMGALAYTLQIYFDFSGYTDMAIGISLLFGIRLPLNFDSPYKSLSIVEFWRRWHMTLSRFLRDYLYIPLGGGRKGPLRRYVNLFITMLLGGLWHGANWTFVVWGALHGFYLVINHAWSAAFPAPIRPRLGRRMLFGGLTMLAVVAGWVFFRATSLEAAVMILKAMAGGSGFPGSFDAWSATLATQYHIAQFNGGSILSMLATALVACWTMPNSAEIAENLGRSSSRVQWQGLGSVAVLILLILSINASRGVSEFIYFNF
jgi:alginate O-acetyltransferase complex protein AlgI